MSVPREVPGLPEHPHSELDLQSYALRVDGLVSHPLTLALDDLRRLPQHPFDADFVCLEGWVAPDQHWAGVALSNVLELAGVDESAAWVQLSSADFSLPLPLDQAGTALLALDLEGAALTPAHGAPVRLVVPGGECFTSVKWVDHIELRAEPAEDTARRIALARLPRK